MKKNPEKLYLAHHAKDGLFSIGNWYVISLSIQIDNPLFQTIRIYNKRKMEVLMTYGTIMIPPLTSLLLSKVVE